MSFTFDFLVQLSKLCQQELSKGPSTKTEPGTKESSSANNTCETLPKDCSNRSAGRCATSTLVQEEHVSSEDTLVALEDPLSLVTIKKEDPEDLDLFTQRFHCPHCKFIATCHSELRTHVGLCSREKQGGCPLCPEGAGLGAAEIDEHIESVHLKSDEIENRDDGSYHCKKCDKVFKHPSHVRKHLLTLKHQGNERCTPCGIILSQQEMAVHQKEIHGKIGNSFTCKIDGLLFSSKMSLDRHIRHVHTTTKELFMCQLCGMTFDRKDNLQKHERNHGDTRRFVCCFCNLTFKAKDTLNTHMKNIHFTPNKYQCRRCFHTFDNNDRLDMHVKMFHEGRHYPCQICGKVFKFYSHKERHLQGHLNSYKNKKVKKEKKSVPKKRKRTKKESRPVEFDSSAEEDDNINKRRTNTREISPYREFDSSAEEDENVSRRRKNTKKESRPVEFDSSAEEDENINKRRKNTREISPYREFDSSAEEDENVSKNVSRRRKNTKKESRPVEFDSSAEENEDINKRRTNTREVSPYREFDSSAEEDENVSRRRKNTKKESRPVEFDSSAEEDENINKRRTNTKEVSPYREFDSSAEEDKKINTRRGDTKKESRPVEYWESSSSTEEETRNEYKKNEDTKEINKSAGANSSGKEEVGTSSLKDVAENVNPSGRDSRKSVQAARVAASSSTKRKENCENRSPSLSKIARKKKKCPEASSLEAVSKSCLSTKDSNVVMSISGGDERCSVARPSKRVRKSRAKGKTNKDQDSENRNLVESAPCDSEMYYVNPAVTIPADTVFLYLNSPNGESIDSFSSLRPESVSESALYIDIDNIPQCDGIGIIDLSSADLCPVEVEYLSGEDAGRLASANDSGFCLTEPIKIDLDSGVSLCSVDEPLSKKAPAKKKSTAAPKRKSNKKYPDSDKKVIVKNLYYSNDDDFVLPEFVIDEDDD